MKQGLQFEATVLDVAEGMDASVERLGQPLLPEAEIIWLSPQWQPENAIGEPALDGRCSRQRRCCQRLSSPAHADDRDALCTSWGRLIGFRRGQHVRQRLQLGPR